MVFGKRQRILMVRFHRLVQSIISFCLLAYFYVKNWKFFTIFHKLICLLFFHILVFDELRLPMRNNTGGSKCEGAKAASWRDIRRDHILNFSIGHSLEEKNLSFHMLRRCYCCAVKIYLYLTRFRDMTTTEAMF